MVYHFAAEGAKIIFTYLKEDEDAETVIEVLARHNVEHLVFSGDLSDRDHAKNIVVQSLKKFGVINCLVNNIAQQYETKDFENISSQQLEYLFRVNVFSFFYLAQEVLPQMTEGDSIINSTSVTAYRGSHHLIDYATTKSAIVGFTRSLAQRVIKAGVRVNAVAPGPVWTPLIPASYDAQQVAEFGAHSPIGKPAQPADVVPTYVFLASADSRYFSGQVLHPNGGEIIGG
ncbi:MAG: SDR family oxidoreductase [Gammaproteobacteria bacterium]